MNQRYMAIFDRISAIVKTPGSQVRKIISNAVWLFLDRILAMGIAFVVSVMVARYLGPSDLGALKYAIAFVFLFSPISSLGMNSVIIREFVERPLKKNQIIGTAFILRFLANIVTVLLVIAGIFLTSDGTSSVRLIVAIISLPLFVNAFTVIEDWFNSQLQAKYIVICKNTGLFISSALRIALVHYKAPLNAFAFAVLLETVIYTGMLVLFYGKRNKLRSFLNWRFDRDEAIFILKESLPLMFNGFAVVIFLMIDQIMLGQMVGNSAVGTYAVAVNLSEMWYMIPGVLTSSLYPSIIRLKTADEAVYKKRLQQYYDLMVILAYCVILLFLPASKPLILSVYGPAFSLSASILAIHILTCPFNFIGISQSSWLISEGLQKFNLYASVLGAILNVVLNFLLIPHLAGIGAAIATLISYAGASYFFFFCFKETRQNTYLTTKALFVPFRLVKSVITRSSLT